MTCSSNSSKMNQTKQKFWKKRGHSSSSNQAGTRTQTSVREYCTHKTLRGCPVLTMCECVEVVSYTPEARNGMQYHITAHPKSQEINFARISGLNRHAFLPGARTPAPQTPAARGSLVQQIDTIAPQDEDREAQIINTKPNTARQSRHSSRYAFSCMPHSQSAAHKNLGPTRVP